MRRCGNSVMPSVRNGSKRSSNGRQRNEATSWCPSKKNLLRNPLNQKARGGSSLKGEKELVGRRKRLPHQGASPCAATWDRRFRLSTVRGSRSRQIRLVIVLAGR